MHPFSHGFDGVNYDRMLIDMKDCKRHHQSKKITPRNKSKGIAEMFVSLQRRFSDVKTGMKIRYEMTAEFA